MQKYRPNSTCCFLWVLRKDIVLMVTSEVLTAVKMSMLVFLVITTYGLVGRYHHFSPEEGDSMFLRYVGIYL
jgi:hypothetical protein